MAKYVVAQTGARRGYAVPAILENAGKLERFYTDICGNCGWGSWLAKGKDLPLIGKRLHRLAGRSVPNAVRCKTRTFALPNLKWLWNSSWVGKNTESVFRLHMKRALELGDLAKDAGFGDAAFLYMMYSEMPSMMIAARNQGVKVISEVYILRSANKIMRDERSRYPGWEDAVPDFDAISSEMASEDVLFTCVDHYLCPSAIVRDDLVLNWGVKPEKTTIVPYGMNPGWLSLEPKPNPGRILFVGTADLRKGIHYLAAASKVLKERGREYEFRVAGHVSNNVRARPECCFLHFLGHISRSSIHEEFQSADVFVLPTLAEGSAEVTYEAMASSLPMVTTASAGSVARHNVEALIVPERDVYALADAIELLVEHRQVRDRLAEAAHKRAKEFTWEKYGERLIKAVSSIEAQ